MPTLVALGHASPAGQATAIGDLGRGTRLVLEGLEVVVPERDELTMHGRWLVQAVVSSLEAAFLAGTSTHNRLLRVRRVARVVATAGPRANQTQDGTFANATYRLEAEGSCLRDAAPLIDVTKTDGDLLVLRGADQAKVKVIDVGAWSELPRVGSAPLVIATPHESAPSSILRRRLVIAETDSTPGRNFETAVSA